MSWVTHDLYLLCSLLLSSSRLLSRCRSTSEAPACAYVVYPWCRCPLSRGPFSLFPTIEVVGHKTKRFPLKPPSHPSS
ncbi:hypothetical protein F4810DRAFT_599483 [Camillea tinctor]|nr:hypothetical protein F4810DRAFT_599483 [Camillea tinctor]